MSSREGGRPLAGICGVGGGGALPEGPTGSFPAGRQPGPRVGMDARPAATQGRIADSGPAWVQKKCGLRALATGAIGNWDPKGGPGPTPSFLAAGPGKGHAHGRGRGSGGPPGRGKLEPLWGHWGPWRAVFPPFACVCWGSGLEDRRDGHSDPSGCARRTAAAASRSLLALSNRGGGVSRPPLSHGRGILRVHGPPRARHLAHPGTTRGARWIGADARLGGEQPSGPAAVGCPGPGPRPKASRIGCGVPYGRLTGSGAAGGPAAAGPGDWRRPAQAGGGKRGRARGRRDLRGHHAQGGCAGAAAGPATRGSKEPAGREGGRSGGSDG